MPCLSTMRESEWRSKALTSISSSCTPLATKSPGAYVCARRRAERPSSAPGKRSGSAGARASCSSALSPESALSLSASVSDSVCCSELTCSERWRERARAPSRLGLRSGAAMSVSSRLSSFGRKQRRPCERRWSGTRRCGEASSSSSEIMPSSPSRLARLARNAASPPPMLTAATVVGGLLGLPEHAAACAPDATPLAELGITIEAATRDSTVSSASRTGPMTRRCSTSTCERVV
mmetsp:Transcript_13877/g.35980  ORF Transcript_13877/g.35980 Transcript_13877/m.35980 type:complete len:235 (+) Transcript_13877:269-973(+)